MIESITNKTFSFERSDIYMENVELVMDTYLYPYAFLAAISLTGVFLPIVGFELYRRFKASQDGLTFALRGSMIILRGRNPCVVPKVAIGVPFDHLHLCQSNVKH